MAPSPEIAPLSMAALAASLPQDPNNAGINKSIRPDQTLKQQQQQEEDQNPDHHRPDYLFRSKLPDIYIPDHLTLPEYCLQRSAREHADKPCLIGQQGRVYTYAEVETLSRRVASGLARLGVGQGEVVMLLLPNCPEFVLAFLGASIRGAVTTTCNPFYTPGEIAKQVSASRARLIITQSAYTDKLLDVVATSINSHHPSFVSLHDNTILATSNPHHQSFSFRDNVHASIAATSHSHQPPTPHHNVHATIAATSHPHQPPTPQYDTIAGPPSSHPTSLLHDTTIPASPHPPHLSHPPHHPPILTILTIDEPPSHPSPDHPGLRFLPFSSLLHPSPHSPPFHPPPIHPDDVVALPYSSGTTGLPKGVMLTHKGLVSSVAQQVDGENPNLYFKSDDVILCVLPMFHIYSLNSVLLCSLRVGASIAIMPKFEIGALLEVIQKHKVTVAPLVPPIVLALSKHPLVEKYDLSSIRMLMSGAAPLGKDLEDAFKARVPHAIIGQGYGMTEAGPVLAMSLAFAKHPFPVKAGSCGTVVRNAAVKIVDPETGISLPHNKPGEICIKGPQIMKGYINDAQATANTIDKEGFLHTGDIGLIDDDEEVFIVDRVKEIIKFKGFQVPPAELEGILLTHPCIADAACVPKKDHVAGEVPIAFVVPVVETSLSEEEVKEFVAKQVVFYKKLHSVIFVDHIPKSPSGKILRKDLRKRLEESQQS